MGGVILNNKVTIKDVAKEAGVSVATVSYVINNRTDMRISDNTRKKVLQVINLLNYTPNQSAQALVTNRNRTIALYLTPNVSVLKRAEQMYLIDSLSTFLHQKGYDLIYLTDSHTEKYDNADAIIGYDISSEYFHQIGDRNFSPFLALDCMINDPLFYEVNSNYEQISLKADAFFQHQAYTLLMLDTPNGEKKSYIRRYFPDVCYIQNIVELAEFAEKNVVLIEQTLYELFSVSPLTKSNQLLYVPAISSQKYDMLFSCIEHALLRTPLEQHMILV